MSKTKLLSMDIVDGFKTAISDTIEKCRCIYDYSENNGFDNFLLYQGKDKGYELIGCVEGGNFLLDSNFMYKRFLDYWKGLHGRLAAVPDKAELYACLCRTKHIIPYGVHFRRPLHSFRLEGSKSKRSEYFCISKESIGYTDAMLNWL